LYRSGRKLGGRPPRDPLRSRLAIWSSFCGMSCGIRRSDNDRRLARDPYALSAHSESRRLRGRPSPPGRATATPSSSRTSAGCPRPGPVSDGWSSCGRVRPRSCGSSWSIRLSTCRALLVALRHQSRAPFTGASGVLMRPCDRGVGVSVPVPITGAVGLGVQRGLDPCPGAIFFPPGEPFVQRLPWPVPFGHISPRHPGTHPKQDPVEHLPVITPPSTTLRGHVRQQRRNPRVLGVGQLEPSTHDRRDSRPSTKDPGDTP
jgi:hypothetical protein